MKFKIVPLEAFLLNGMLRQPQTLAGHMARCSPPLREYTSTDRAGALHLLKIRHQWLESKVMKKRPGGDDSGYEFVDYDGSLKKVHAERILQVVVHYQPLGFLPDMAEAYWKIRDQLEGKAIVDDEDTDLEDAPKAIEPEPEAGKGPEHS